MFIYYPSLAPSPNLLTEVRKKKIFKLICAVFVFPYIGFSDITLINHTVLKGHDLNFTYINILVFPLWVSGRLFFRDFSMNCNFQISESVFILNSYVTNMKNKCPSKEERIKQNWSLALLTLAQVESTRRISQANMFLNSCAYKNGLEIGLWTVHSNWHIVSKTQCCVSHCWEIFFFTSFF